MSKIEYVQGGKELLGLVEPLWKKLRNHHIINSNYFVEHFERATFETRKRKFIEDEKAKVKISLVKDVEKNAYIGYCISTIDKELSGEIDSLFVEGEYRKLGIGDELMKMSMEWMDRYNIESRKIIVAEGNENVFKFYKRFEFYPKRTVLEWKK